MIHMAIISPNTLTAMGLKYILQQAMPALNVAMFRSWQEAELQLTDSVGHLFVDESLLPPPRESKLPISRTIKLATKTEECNRQPCLNMMQTPQQILHTLMMMMRAGHYQRQAHGIQPYKATSKKELTMREKEVLMCVVKGLINKEIAEALHISMTTVITHRKNITDKLNIKSVAGLTLYAIVHGLVDPMTILAR